ncbi:MAG: hypothetical protein ACLFV5_09320 [Anaerolineales bacterium]
MWFSLLFTLVHTGAYVIAGMLALKVSEDLYHGENRLLDFVNDMSDPGQSGRTQKWFVLGQLLRGLLLSIVLYPVLESLGELSFGLRCAFMAGLMFVYTDFASAVPFPHNIEGFVYLKDRYLSREAFWKLQFEIIIYSLLFGLFAAWLLF